MPTIGVISDDTTGACGAAGRLADRGWCTLVTSDPDARIEGYHAVVADTRARDTDSAHPDLVRDWASRFRASGVRWIHLRVDSTFRGRPADDLTAVIEGAGFVDPVVVAVTAHPEAGRTTKNGIQEVTNFGEETRHIDVVSALFGTSPSEVAGTVSTGGVSLEPTLSDAVRNGIRNIVVDAAQDSDLREAAVAVASLDHDEVVTVSSGAWLRYHPNSMSGPVIVVLASPTETNHQLLGDLHRTAGVTFVPPNEGGNEASVNNASVLVVETISERPQGDPSVVAAETVIALLNSMAARCVGVVVSGGRAAAALLDRMNSSRVEAIGEPQALCGLARVVDGPYAGLRIVTKGGQIGTKGTMEGLISAVRGEPRPRWHAFDNERNHRGRTD